MSAPRRQGLAVQLRCVGPGMYETKDGRYGVVRVESVGEWDTVSGDGWAIVQGDARTGEELPGGYRTKRDAVVALAAMLDPA